MLLSLALAMTLAADEGPEEARWFERGHGDGGVEAPSIAGCAQRSTALQVKQPSESGGTMHFAGKTVISCKRCGGPLTLKGDENPLIEHVLDLGKRRYLLLGWSSGGSGMQTVKVLLVRVGPRGPVLVDTLDWVTTRAERGILLTSTPQGWRLGLPQPNCEAEDPFGAVLAITSGKQRSGAELLEAGFFKPLPPGLSAFGYVPPFGEGLRTHVNAGWVRVTEKGFDLVP